MRRWRSLKGVTLRSFRTSKGIAFLFVTSIILIFLLLTPPKYAKNMREHCPAIYGDTESTRERRTADSPIVDCRQILHGKAEEVQKASQYKWCQRWDAISDNDYITMTQDCLTFKEARGYNDHTVSEREKNFPVAFSILMHENGEQFERLLRAIWRQQNIYCIHVDAKSSSKLFQAVKSISKCFDNVIVLEDQINIHWAEFTVLEAELLCLKRLWQHQHWKYYINLGGREFPLTTNRELVEILQAYNGANDIGGSAHSRPHEWTDYVWRKEFWRTSQRKPPPPHDFLIVKGSTHVIASRAFIGYALHDPKAQHLLEWMRDIRVPDEHFFQTLNHNPHFGIPGAFKGHPDSKPYYARFKIWQNDRESCHGEWLRFVCNLGVGDLSRLVGRRHLFVNKLRLEMAPLAYQCLEQRHRNRTQADPKDIYFNVDFYKQLKFVNEHVKS